MEILFYISTFAVIMSFIIIETGFYFWSRDRDVSRKWNRLLIYYTIYISYLVIVLSTNVFVGYQKELDTSYWLSVIILIYVTISEVFLYQKDISVRFVRNNSKFTLLFGGIALLIGLTSYSLVRANSGLIFGSADWFSITFLSVLRSESIYGIIALMTIGGITTIIGRARRSATMSIMGYFLVVGLPIFSVFDSLFQSSEDIEFTAPELITAFENEAIAIIVHTVVLILFYVLLASIVLAFSSLVDAVGMADDD